MKKFLTLIVLLTVLVGAPKAQFVVIDSVYPTDPMKASSKWHAYVAHTDTGHVQLQWKHCQTCIVFPGGNPVTVMDSVATTTTITVADTGWYWLREVLTVTDTNGVVTISNTLWLSVYVDLPDTIPTISYAGAGMPNSTSGSQLLNLNSGNTLSAVTVYASPGDTLYSNPIQVDVFTVTGGAQTYNYTFGNLSGGLPGYKFSYKFKIQNYKGQNITPKGVMITSQDSSAAWVAQHADVVNSTDSNLYAHYQALTGGAAGHGGFHWRKLGATTWTDTLDLGVFTAQPNAINLAGTLSNLMADSTYQRQACFTTSFGTATSAIETWTVPSHPTTFALTTPLSYFNGGNSQAIQGTAVLPKGAGTFVCALTLASDVNFTSFNVRTSSLVQKSAPGVHTLLNSFDNLVDGVTYRAMWYGNDTANGYLPLGANGPNQQVVFTFHTPTDSIKPTATLQLQYKTDSEIGVTFTGADNDSLAGFILTDNGQAHVLPATATSFTFTNELPNSSHYITLQSFDAVPLYSDIESMTVVTDATATTPTAATITSVPASFCVSNGWAALAIHGSNIQIGAKVVANYYDGQPNDTTVINYTSSTDGAGRIWIGHHYDSVDVVVINPGANSSNVLRTKVMFCTGIEETGTRTEGSLLAISSNPFVDVVSVEVGVKTDYTIYSIMGEKVAAGKLTKGTNQISLKQLPAGAYIFSTTSGLSQKMVKVD